MPRRRKPARSRRGAGSVKPQPDGTWRAWLPPVDGRRESRRGFRTEAEARAWLAARLAERATDSQASSDWTLAAWIEDWGKRHAARLAPNSLAAYDTSLHRFSALGSLRLRDLTHRDVQRALAEMLEQGRKLGVKRRGPGLALRTVRIARAALATVLADAVPDLLPHNPAIRARLPKVEKGPPRAYSQAQRDALLRAARGHPGELFVVLALGSGCRIGELRALQWRDVDWQAGALWIERQRTGRQREPRPTKTRAGRVARLTSWAFATLRAHRPAGPVPGGWVFGGPSGEPWSGDTFRTWLRSICERAGVPCLGPHALRHTFASLAFRGGADGLEVARQLGHTTPAVTLSTYAHFVTADNRKSAVEALESLETTKKRRQSRRSAPVSHRDKS